MKNIRKLFLTLPISISSGCAHWYSQNEKSLSVEITRNRSSLPHHCREIQPLKSYSAWGARLAQIDLQNAAAKLNATHLLITRTDYGFWQQGVHGTAMKCAKKANS